MTDLKRLFLAGIMGGMIAAGMVMGVLIDRKSPDLKIVKINLQSLLKEEAQRISDQKLFPEEERKALKRALSHLHHVLQKLPPHIVVLDASAVLSPHVADETDFIREECQKERNK